MSLVNNAQMNFPRKLALPEPEMSGGSSLLLGQGSPLTVVELLPLIISPNLS